MLRLENRNHKRRVDVPPDVCLCSSCGQHFEDAESYDAHIVMQNDSAIGCLNTEMEMDAEGLVRTTRGVWVLFD